LLIASFHDSLSIHQKRLAIFLKLVRFIIGFCPKHIWHLLQVDEWWEQPAATAVDWITVDGQNVATWLAHVKQLQMAFYDKQLL